MACETLIPAERLGRGRSRAHTVSMRRFSKRELALGEMLYPPARGAPLRPKTWGECQSRGLGVESPCPFVSCKHHLALDVSERTGSIKVNFPDLEVWEMTETCVLAVVEKHADGFTLEQIGEVMNLTRERIRQYEMRCRGALRSKIDREAL